MRFLQLTTIVFLTTSGAAQAQTAIDVDSLACLLVEQNSVVEATVTNDIPGSSVRLYFRRLHEEVEDFYWVEMEPKGDGSYWGIFPKPMDEVLERRELRDLEEEVRQRWARWWREKEVETDRDPNDDLDAQIIEERASIGRGKARDWMADFDDDGLELWLDEVEYEPTEYYSAVLDSFGEVIAVSGLEAVRVQSDCPSNLTPQQAGLAENLTVGETAQWQEGEEVFHWLCDGVVSRVGVDGVWRGDEICRACVIAWWKNKAFLIPTTAATGSGTGVILFEDSPQVSPFQP